MWSKCPNKEHHFNEAESKRITLLPPLWGSQQASGFQVVIKKSTWLSVLREGTNRSAKRNFPIWADGPGRGHPPPRSSTAGARCGGRMSLSLLPAAEPTASGRDTHWPPRQDGPWRGCLRISGEKASFLRGRHVVHGGPGQILTWCDSGHLLLQIMSAGVQQALTAQHSVPALLLLSCPPPPVPLSLCLGHFLASESA